MPVELSFVVAVAAEFRVVGQNSIFAASLPAIAPKRRGRTWVPTPAGTQAKGYRGYDTDRVSVRS